ncbi:NAD-dependent epimerase/dehydratase family protein [Paraneptunicella aestuarii]|uniref:NAD-dependent epimerase/dehydratase family protein n=1 Tax=Paraneptunicella aestuarii TaxID=2831148 RepID=UPI001E2B07D9|nr:NAD-dependent epimerase/dehydratase family protein [Paraneptunicella aestuarii]UAA39668.1 NAD-dependent epimerase/dehydratase family protein [Paraneptunicella aestuarii]
MKPKVLLTGATGFVGRQVMNDLKQRDVELFALVRNTSDINENEAVTVIGHDSIENYAGEGLPEKLDVIIHLVAKAHVTEDESNRAEYERVNVAGTQAMVNLAKAKDVKHFIYLSSIKVNGDETFKEPITEASEVCPKGVYAETKYQAENLANELADNGIKVSIVRPPLVYGAGVKANMAALTKLVRLLPVLPFGMINNQRSLISVRNLSDFLMTLVFELPVQSYERETFIVSDRNPLSIRELCLAIAQGLHKKVIMLPVPQMLLSVLTKVFGMSRQWQKLAGNMVLNGLNSEKYFSWVAPYQTADEIKLFAVKELK